MSLDEAVLPPSRDPVCQVAERLAELPAPLRLWLKPVQQPLEVVVATSGKPVGQMTMLEVMSWVYVVGYCAASGMLAGRIAANITMAALRGPYRR